MNLKDVRILWQKFLNFLSPKPIEIKKPIREKGSTRQEKLRSLVSEIGKEIFNIRAEIAWGSCPHCESLTSLISTAAGYYRCTTLNELTRQYVNGSVKYVPINQKEGFDYGAEKKE